MIKHSWFYGKYALELNCTLNFFLK